MKYTSNSKDLYFIKESGSSSLLLIKSTGKTLALNVTGKWILDNVWAYNDSKFLLEHMCDTYKGIPPEEMQDDLDRFLYILDINGIITLENNDILFNRDGIHFIDEKSYKKYSEFYNKAKSLIQYGQTKKMLSAKEIRSDVVNFEKIYLYLLKDNNFVLSLKAKINEENNTILELLDIYISDKNVCIETNIKIREMIKNILETLKYDVCKIRIKLIKDEADNRYYQTVDLLKNIGFHLECILNQEVQDYDVEYYLLKRNELFSDIIKK